MKNVYIVLNVLLLISTVKAQNVGIGTNSPAASAQLDVSSTTGGFLPPRLTIAQRDSIANPTAGLVIFCIECNELELYNGTIWKNMSGRVACLSPTFPFVKICNNIWMCRNLDVTRYRNGDLIPEVTDVSAWSTLTTGAWCWYNNDSVTYAASYGKLYNWYAVNDSRGLAPSGWHIPADSEWTILSACLGGDALSGGNMKEAGSAHWLSPNTGATNSSGFSGFPGGDRNVTGLFYSTGNYGFYWTTTPDGTIYAWSRYLYTGNSALGRFNGNRKCGFYVRCLRD